MMDGTLFGNGRPFEYEVYMVDLINPDVAPNGDFHGIGISIRSCSRTTASLE